MKDIVLEMLKKEDKIRKMSDKVREKHINFYNNELWKEYIENKHNAIYDDLNKIIFFLINHKLLIKVFLKFC